MDDRRLLSDKTCTWFYQIVLITGALPLKFVLGTGRIRAVTL